MAEIGWLVWLIVGGLTGWLASRITRSRMGPINDIMAGMLGALLGGILFNIMNASYSEGFNLWSVFVAMIGSIVLLAVLRRTNTHSTSEMR